MPPDISVATDPIVVYGMVGLLIGAILLALIFARPRRGLGAATREDAAKVAPGDGPWMPGGDVFGHDKPQVTPPPPLDELPTFPTFPTAAPPPERPAAHDPWSTLATDETAQQPRWDKP